MKLKLVAILTICTLFQLAVTYQNKDSPSFKTGELVLSASFTQGENKMKPFSIPEQYQVGDRLSISILDLRVENNLS